MKTSAAGRALIEQREGRRLVAYDDATGPLTIGVGHTGRMSPPPVSVGMRITEAECDAMLAADLGPVEAAIHDAVKVPISQNEFDALASLGFNIGTGGLRGSTVIKRLNLGDIAGAAEAFMLWNRPASLVRRRRAERAQFLAPDGAVAVARAATLATLAETTKIKARTAQSGAAALAVASGTTFVATHAPHPAVALVLGGVALAVAVACAFFAAFHHRAARTLAENADRQALAARERLVGGSLDTASTAFAEILKQ